MSRILLVEDDPALRLVLARSMERAGHQVIQVADGPRALELLQGPDPCDLAILDVRLPGLSGLDLLERLPEERRPPVVVITAENTPANAIRSMRAGALEYLTKPVDLDELDAVVDRALAGRERSVAQPAPAAAPPPDELIGTSRAMQEVFKVVGRAARSQVSVLVVGASGTGKELVARSIHRHSARRNAAFVPVNTAAIPESLLESELFGHVRGAFTGANEAREGRFQLAHGGTLFLDEIGEMPYELQAKLLRAVQERSFYPVGATRPVSVDVRIVCATHRDLEERVRAGQFREDLYHRLNVVRLTLPTLAQRREDIPQLARVFAVQASAQLGLPARQLDEGAIDWLVGQRWPGQVRELKNCVTRAVALSTEAVVGVRDLVEPQTPTQPLWRQLLPLVRPLVHEPDAHQRGVAALERALFTLALEQTGGNQLRAARLLSMNRNTLRARLNALGLDPRTFTSGAP